MPTLSEFNCEIWKCYCMPPQHDTHTQTQKGNTLNKGLNKETFFNLDEPGQVGRALVVSKK